MAQQRRPGRKPRRAGNGSRDQAQSKRARNRSSGGKERRPRPSVQLPRRVEEDLRRTSSKRGYKGALGALTTAAEALAAGRYPEAVKQARKAKESAPRDAAVREVLGLAEYRLGNWHTALRELRTYRRMTGESTHLPVEMDVLRALDRKKDVEEAWRLLITLGGPPVVMNEGKVVYASFLLDEGRSGEAWEVARPAKAPGRPGPGEIRLWFAAARAAKAVGESRWLDQLVTAIERADPGLAGLEELKKR